jgi:hypothetical protein
MAGTSAGAKKRTRSRWTGTDPEQRSAQMRELSEAAASKARADKIARLIASAPPLTAEQKSRLAVLLNSHPEAA